MLGFLAVVGVLIICALAIEEFLEWGDDNDFDDFAF
jgi:hypothetical protein